MTRREKTTKEEILKGQGTLNTHAERVRDQLFKRDPFFDPIDLVQVKYEMIRRVSHEGESKFVAASDFGFSRPSFYEAYKVFQKEGLGGLIPKKRGPQGGHKLTQKIMQMVLNEIENDKTLSSVELIALVKKVFGVTVHRRSIERAILRCKKK